MLGIRCERGSHRFFKRYGEKFEDSEGKRIFVHDGRDVHLLGDSPVTGVVEPTRVGGTWYVRARASVESCSGPAEPACGFAVLSAAARDLARLST